jgi:predicted dehydrogenase
VNEIRIGIAGLGRRAHNWISLLQRIPGYRITAVYDWIEALHAPALARMTVPGGVQAFARYDDFLACREMDAVAICVRQKELGAMAAQALEAGKHVNSEVPAAYTMADCWRIVTNVERTGLVYNLAEQTRFWGFVDGWRELARSGRLGKITYCEGQYFGYSGTSHYFQDYRTGRKYSVEAAAAHADAVPTFQHPRPPICSASFDLSILLKVLEDRVTTVSAMSTGRPSHAWPEISQPDVQAALMHTEKDTLIRMMNGFTQPRPDDDHHWWQIVGTRGSVEWRRSRRDKPKLWLADSQMWDWTEVDWRYERTDAPPEARATGHGDADYYVQVAFRDAVLKGTPLEFDVYKVMDTMAPALRAVDSIEAGGQPMSVPDFRPSAARPAGQMPADLGGVGVR